LLFLHCKTCANVIGLLKATYLLTYLLIYYMTLWVNRPRQSYKNSRPKTPFGENSLDMYTHYAIERRLSGIAGLSVF